MTNLVDREHDLVKDYTEKAIKNAEIFRSESQMFHGRFTRARRKQIKRIESTSLSSYDLLMAWQDQLAPDLQKLEESRNSNAFNKSVAKHLQVQGAATQDVVDQIIRQRREQLNSKFLDQFKKRSTKKIVKELIEKPFKEIQALKDQYIHVTLTRMVAKEHGINIVDPHSSLLGKISSVIRVRRERKKRNKREQKRIHEIDARIQEIEKNDSNLIGGIMSLRVDLMSILAARTSFEKRLSKLAKDEAIDAAARLEIFNDETRKIRYSIISDIPGSAEMSLESVYAATKITDELLLRIFDLTNTQKNNLLLQTKEHRELREERDKIIQSQKERLAVIK